MELRPYQREAIEAVMAHWREWDREVLVMATGTGKTVTAREIARQRLAAGNVLFLAHRDELLEQAAATFGGAGLIKGPTCDIRPITVGSVMTLANRPSYDFSTIIVDECHHATSESYRRVLDAYPHAKVLGLTATPDRAGLDEVFQGVAYEYDIRDAVGDGYLSPVKARTVPIDIDLTGVDTCAGDLDAAGVGDAIEPYLERIADAIKEYASDRRTLVFCPLISVSKELEGVLNRKGVPAWEIDGTTPDRADMLDWFRRAPKGSVLCNAMLLTEGVDIPTVDCIVILRATQSRSLYVQMVGRGLRLAKGKGDCLILDFLWLSRKHDLCCPAELLSKDEAVRRKVANQVNEGETDLLAATKDAEEEERRSLMAHIDSHRHARGGLIDPLVYFAYLKDAAYSAYRAEFTWQSQPITEKQDAFLRRHGICADGLTRGQASVIIDKLVARMKRQLATPKQIRCLEKHGYRDVSTWTFDQASRKMDELAMAHYDVSRLPVAPENFTWEGSGTPVTKQRKRQGPTKRPRNGAPALAGKA